MYIIGIFENIHVYRYIHVQGSVTALQRGSPDAFRPEAGRGDSTIDGAYMDGECVLHMWWLLIAIHG